MSRMSRFRMILSAVAFALFAVACGGAASTAVGPAEAPAGATEEPVSPLTGTFATIGDGEIDLASLQGQDVVLWFWAPW